MLSLLTSFYSRISHLSSFRMSSSTSSSAFQQIPIFSNVHVQWLQSELAKVGHTVSYPTSEYGPNKTLLDHYFSHIKDQMLESDWPNFRLFLINQTIVHIEFERTGHMCGIHREGNTYRLTDDFIRHTMTAYNRRFNKPFRCETLFDDSSSDSDYKSAVE